MSEREALDPLLDAELASRADGAALRRILRAVPRDAAAAAAGAPAGAPAGTPANADARREQAWERLQARLHAPGRAPYTVDTTPPVALVTDERPVVAPVSAGSPSAGSASIASDRATPPRARRRWGMLAAAAVALLTVSAWQYGNAPVTTSVTAGTAVQAVRLADGSTAWLAPGSSLTHVRRFSWAGVLASRERLVELQGEAFFDVARDGRPFLVRTSDADVQVLGTRFDVRAAHAGYGSRVQVEEGRVSVRHGREHVVLGAGDGAMVVRGTLERRRVPVARVAVWRRGGLAALDEPLGEVLSELARRFAVTIEVDPVVETSALVSLFYADSVRVEGVLADLAVTQGLQFERTSRGFRLRPGAQP